MKKLQPKALSPKLVERGEISKTMIYNGTKIEIALLELSPGSKIRRHRHTEDRETYFFIKEKCLEFCDIGKNHSLENNTKEIMQVISIKVRV